MFTRSPILLSIALVALLLPAATASASYSTKVVVSLKTPAFHGKLKSGNGTCTKSRTVKLFRKKPGADKLLGTDRSNAKAKWSIPIGRVASGASYYAKAPARGNCKAGKSKTIAIG